MSLLLALFAQPMMNGLPDNARKIPPAQVRQLIADYGSCIVKRERDRAAAAIAANLDSGQLLNRYPQLLQETCLTNQLGDRVEVRFSGDQYRFAIADALVRRDFAAASVPDFESVPPLAHSDPAPAGNYMWRYGECVVRLDPAAARALLLTDPSTAAESAGFQALGTAMATCLGEGRKLEFGKAELRGTLAVNFYRLASAARGARVTERGS